MARSSSRTAASARAWSIATGQLFSLGVDGTVVRHLDDLLGGVLLGERVGSDRGRLVDLVLDARVSGGTGGGR